MKMELVDCSNYVEDPCICDSCGEPKGQCARCGAKWFEHRPDAISDIDDRKSAEEIQKSLAGNLDN